MQAPLPLFTRRRGAEKGSALILTIMMVVLLTLELAIVSLISLRGFGDEGLLFGQSLTVRRSAETAVNQLSNSLYTYLASGKTPLQAFDPGAPIGAFEQGGGSAIAPTLLQTTNPDGGTSSTGVYISAWVSERRGNYFHIVGRAQLGGVDNLVHKWIKVNPCGGSPGGLMTILTGEDQPGSSNNAGYATTNTMAVSPVDGRVFFGEAANPGSFWTWKNGVLSTLVSAEAQPGLNTTFVGPDGRVFFAEKSDPGSFWTWKEETGLTTIVSAESYPVKDHCGRQQKQRMVADDGRIFFGEDTWGGNFWTWHPSTGLSTLLSGASPGVGLSNVNRSGRVIVGEWGGASSKAWTWHTSTGLSTLPGTFDNPGYGCSAVISDEGTMFFGESAAPWSEYFAYKNGILTSIIPSASGLNQLGPNSSFVTTDGRVFFGEDRSPGYFFTWKASTGLSTLLGRTHDTPGRWFGGTLARDNRFYWGAWGPTGGYWTWKESTGMSTINNSIGWMGVEAMDTVPNDFDNRLFVGGWISTFFTWKENGTAAGVLSTIVTGAGSPGADNTAVAPDGRVFFGEYATPGKYWTWKNGVLSTILSGVDAPGAYATVVAPDGRIYLGQKINPGTMWTWKDPANCDTGP